MEPRFPCKIRPPAPWDEEVSSRFHPSSLPCGNALLAPITERRPCAATKLRCCSPPGSLVVFVWTLPRGSHQTPRSLRPAARLLVQVNAFRLLLSECSRYLCLTPNQLPGRLNLRTRLAPGSATRT